jgi:hypothetical protein
MALVGGAVTTDATVAVEALFRPEYRRLVGLARLLVDDAGQAEEVVQDAFVALHRHWSRLVDYEHLDAGADGAWVSVSTDGTVRIDDRVIVEAGSGAYAAELT